MKLYELSETGRKLTNMFLEEEIDEQTLEDSRELIKAEIEVVLRLPEEKRYEEK